VPPDANEHAHPSSVWEPGQIWTCLRWDQTAGDGLSWKTLPTVDAGAVLRRAFATSGGSRLCRATTLPIVQSSEIGAATRRIPLTLSLPVGCEGGRGDRLKDEPGTARRRVSGGAPRRCRDRLRGVHCFGRRVGTAGGFQVSSSPENVLAKLPLADPQQRYSSRSRPHAPATIHKPGLTLLRR
jgi:hypothetical protein